MKILEIPKTSLVVLCGPAGCGKSSFAKKHFSSTQVVSSDHCRALVSDDEENIAASKQSFNLFRFIIDQRLSIGRLTVADSTALTSKARRELIAQGRKHDFQVILLVFDIPLQLCTARNLSRPRKVPDKIIKKHRQQLDRTLLKITSEDFDHIYILNDEEKDSAKVKIIPLSVELPLSGPFDIIGDIHGCCDELELLLAKLEYRKQNNVYTHPDGRIAVFTGDLGDRGPRCLDSIKLVMDMASSGHALYVPGNHCQKLKDYFAGRKIKVGHGMEKTMEELQRITPANRERVKNCFMEFYKAAQPYLILDNGNLIVSHAGIKENMIGRLSKKIFEFCLYGDTTGNFTADGLPERLDWAAHYYGKSLVVYGHTPVEKAELRNKTINIDQGCVLGGRLTALRYPELDTVQVESRKIYYPHGFIRNNDIIPVRSSVYFQPNIVI